MALPRTEAHGDAKLIFDEKSSDRRGASANIWVWHRPLPVVAEVLEVFNDGGNGFAFHPGIIADPNADGLTTRCFCNGGLLCALSAGLHYKPDIRRPR